MTIKSILAVDFDGVIHSYTSLWKDAQTIPDAPVPGAMEFLFKADQKFQVAIFSSRSSQFNGIPAMQDYIYTHMVQFMNDADGKWAYDFTYYRLLWPKEKPAAFLTIDDRAMTFRGTWPDIDDLMSFKPWNKVRPITDNLINVDALADNGQAWTDAFIRTAKRLGHFDLDEGWLLGWFCNCIEISHIARRKKRSEDMAKVSEALSLFASAIKSGERWTETCEEAQEKARAAMMRLAEV